MDTVKIHTMSLNYFHAKNKWLVLKWTVLLKYWERMKTVEVKLSVRLTKKLTNNYIYNI